MWLYVGLALLALAYYIYKSFSYDHWDKKGIPTASGCEWFFGHYKPLLFVKKHMNDFYGPMYREFPDAPLVGYYVMNQPGLLIRDVDIIKTVLMTEFQSFNSNGFSIDKKVDILAGVNPFFLTGEEWKTARSRITPALSLAKLKGYLPNILAVGDELVKYLNKSDGAIELESRELANKFTTDVIANTIYGLKNNAFEDENSLFRVLTREIVFEFSVKDNLKMFTNEIPVLKKIFPSRFTTKALQDLMVSLTGKVIKERTASGEKRNDVIQVLMALKENDTQGVFTNDYISGQIFTVITDLYDTSSNAISLMLYMISRHPDIQNRLRTEIKEIMSRTKGELTIEDIENAKYLDMVFSETFRYFSFASHKVCTQDCNVPLPGSKTFRVTKGTPLVIPVAAIHRDPRYYPEPDKYDPERFTEEELAKRPRFCYLPFGEGPRKCMGMRIASLQIKIAVMKVLENFNVKPSPKTTFPIKLNPKSVITLCPIDGAWVIYEKINK